MGGDCRCPRVGRIRLEEMNMDRRGRKKRVEALEQSLKALKLFKAQHRPKIDVNMMLGGGAFWRGIS